MSHEAKVPATSSPVKDDGWRSKSLAELMAEQGVNGPQDLDALSGNGSDYWSDDTEFEQFLAWLRESRREGR
jgi:hypothetical protein